ncbi:MAG: 2-amino-4-hydroxy-6-hydroxymethyldihydropteridine diphosphokinase [Bacteroidaceae bacterium]|nr:2-amino-4-hydroxy-6-hydroxymethyldihydropteridine diphosphokinase [Bacteroidaceae bacterium]
MNNNVYEIVISLGSNDRQESNMALAKQLLEQLFSDIRFTDSVWTNPVGIESDKFLNCLAIAHSKHREPQIKSALKRVQIRCGDTRAFRSINIVRMDIDILLFDGKRQHAEDWQRPYIKNLMKEIKHFRVEAKRAERAKEADKEKKAKRADKAKKARKK